jgi:hypothetical protein
MALAVAVNFFVQVSARGIFFFVIRQLRFAAALNGGHNENFYHIFCF